MSIGSFYSIFCDDVRIEINDKLSFIGVYSSDLIVDKLPRQLKLLRALFKVDIPLLDNDIKSIKLIVTDGKNINLEQIYNLDDVRKDVFVQSGQKGINDKSNINLLHVFTLENIKVENGTCLETSIEYNDKRLFGEKITIRQAP